MTQTLTEAHEQLFTRPHEDRFATWQELRDDAAAQRTRSREVAARDCELSFETDGIVRFGDEPLQLTNLSLTQLAGAARLPMGVLQRLTPETRARALSETFTRSRRFRVGLVEDSRLRASTSDNYVRVFDDEILDRVDRWLIGAGFQPAVPTDGGPNARGDNLPALYRSDRDMFVFAYSQELTTPRFGGLRRGIFIQNSETGCRSLRYQTFVLRQVCQNHLVLGATDVVSRSARHTGKIREFVNEFDQDLRRISAEVSPMELKLVERAARTPFARADDHAAVLRRLQSQFRVPRRLAEAAVNAMSDEDNPDDSSVWSVVNGLTAAARDEAYAADRTAIAELAGQVLLAR